MQITETKVKVPVLCKNYSDIGDDGVFGFDEKLTIRPAFQKEREFVHNDKQRGLILRIGARLCTRNLTRSVRLTV